MTGLWDNMQNSSCVCWGSAQNSAFCSTSLGSHWMDISPLLLCSFPATSLYWLKCAWVGESPEQKGFQYSFRLSLILDPSGMQSSRSAQSNSTPHPSALARASLCDYYSKVLLVSKASFLLGRLGSFSLRAQPDVPVSHCKQGAFPRRILVTTQVHGQTLGEGNSFIEEAEHMPCIYSCCHHWDQ